MSILAKTTNLFQLYRHVCGESEVPDIYHFWCCVSLIASAVEDRVWYQKFKHEQLYPNLFIMLVGPSGLGKGTAISAINRIADKSLNIRRYRGRTTSANLIDLLGKAVVDEWGRKTLANPKLWLIMDELQNDVSSNRGMVRDFIFLMTELYTASNYKVQTGTRTHGGVDIEKPIINWLAGTTEGSLRDILTKDLLDSGFTARTCFVFGEYDFSVRCPRIKYPDDYDQVFEHLCVRFWALQQAQGAFAFTPTADAELEKWYCTRPEPGEELLCSTWKRHHDLLLKFAMILCLADGGPLVIRHGHVVKAQQMVDKTFQFSEKLIGVASETRETKSTNVVEKYIKKKGSILHTPASRYFRNVHGMNSQAFRMSVQALIAEGLVKQVSKKRQALQYEWVG